MLRFDAIVFGPIKSRRLGTSLGINLLPLTGKLCNFDCIYCECGWNSDGRTSDRLPSADDISEALEAKLLQLREEGVKVDSITFSGHGEPTLHPQFASIVDATLALRDRLSPTSAISVLSNATMLDREEIVEALKKVDNPILKLDSGLSASARMINRPNMDYSVDSVVEGMKKFDGDFVLQTMFVGGSTPDFRKDREDLEAWKNIVRELKPRKVQIYTLDRPSPMQGLEKLDKETMKELVKDLIEDKYNIELY